MAEKNKNMFFIVNKFLHDFLKDNPVLVKDNRMLLDIGSDRFSVGKERKGVVLNKNYFTLTIFSPTYAIPNSSKKSPTLFEYFSYYIEDKSGNIASKITKSINNLGLSKSEESELKKAIYGNRNLTAEEKQAIKEFHDLKDNIGEIFLSFLQSNPLFLKSQTDSYLYQKKGISENILNKNLAFELKEEMVSDLLNKFKSTISSNMQQFSQKFPNFFKEKGITSEDELLDELNFTTNTFETMPVTFFSKNKNGYSIQLRVSEINKKAEDYNKRYRVLGNSQSFLKNITAKTETLIITEGMTDFLSGLGTMADLYKSYPQIKDEILKTGLYSIQAASSSQVMPIAKIIATLPDIKNIVFLNDMDEAGQLFVQQLMETFLTAKDRKEINFINGSDIISSVIKDSGFDLSDLSLNHKKSLLGFLSQTLSNPTQMKHINTREYNKIKLINHSSLEQNHFIVNKQQHFLKKDIEEALKAGKSLYMTVGQYQTGEGSKFNKYIKLENESQYKQFLKGESVLNILFEPYKEELYEINNHTYSEIESNISDLRKTEEYLELTDEEKDILEKRIEKGSFYFKDVYTRIKAISPAKAQEFLNYYFTIKKFTDWCRENNIIYTTSGSAGGSVLLKALNITTVPLKQLIHSNPLAEERYLNPYIDVANFLPDIDIEVPNDDETKKKVKSFLETNGMKVALLGVPGNWVPHGVKHYQEKGVKTKRNFIPEENNELMKTTVAMDVLERAYRNPIQELSRELSVDNIGDTRRILEFFGEYNCTIDNLEEGIIGDKKIPQFKLLALVAAHKFFDIDYEYEYNVKAKLGKQTLNLYKVKNTSNKFIDDKGKLYNEYNGKITSIYSSDREFTVDENSKNEDFKKEAKYLENKVKRENITNISDKEMQFFTALSRPYYTNSMIKTVVNGQIIIFEIDKEDGTLRRVDGQGTDIKYADIKSPSVQEGSKSVRIITNEVKSKFNSKTKIGNAADNMRINKYFIIKKDKKKYILDIKYIDVDFNDIPQKEKKEIDEKKTEGKKIHTKNSSFYIWISKEETIPLTENISKVHCDIETTSDEPTYVDGFKNKYNFVKKNGKEYIIKVGTKNLLEVRKREETSKGLKLLIYREYPDKKEYNTYLVDENESNTIGFFESYDTETTITDKSILALLDIQADSITITKDNKFLFNKFLSNHNNNTGSNFKFLEDTNGILTLQEDVMMFLEFIYSKKYPERKDYFEKINYIRKSFSSLGKIPVSILEKISKEYLPELLEITYSIEDDNVRNEALGIMHEQILRPDFLFNNMHTLVIEEAAMISIVASKYKDKELVMYELDEKESALLGELNLKYPDITQKIGGKVYIKKEYVSLFKYIYEMNLIIFEEADSFKSFNTEANMEAYLNKNRKKPDSISASSIAYKKQMAVKLTEAYGNRKKLSDYEKSLSQIITQIMITPPTGFAAEEEEVVSNKPQHKF